MAKKRASFESILRKAAADRAPATAKAPAKKDRPKGPTLIQQSRRVSDEQKALYHNVLGAGKNQVKRRFLGLTDTEAGQIRQKVSDGIQKAIADSTRR